MRNLFKLLDFWLKIVFLRNRQKVIFWPKNFLTRVKKIFLDKNHQKFAKAIQIRVSRECFLTFLINFLILKILTKKNPQKSLLGHFFSKLRK